MSSDPRRLAMSLQGDREIVMSRSFVAPRALVFRAFTEPRLVARWLLGGRAEADHLASPRRRHDRLRAGRADGFPPSEETTLFTLPQGRAAHLRFEGPYEALPGAWARLFDACRHEGWSPAGLNWEVYAEADPRVVTDLYALLS